MKKILKPLLIGIAVVLLIIFSLDINNLQEYKSGLPSVSFNAVDYAAGFWQKELPAAIEEAPDISVLFRNIEENPEDAFLRYGNKLGISGTGYFLVKGSGDVVSIDQEFIVVSASDGRTIRLATEYIFGNAVRDGSGRVNINDFVNMTDFNNTSVEINNLIKDKVIPRLVNLAQPGKRIKFAGAAEIREEKTDLDSLLLIPVKINLIDESRN